MVRRPIHPTSRVLIAERLQLTRIASGLSQATWCRRVGISTQAWNNYEKNVNRISLDMAIRVCIASGVTLDWIYRGVMGAMPNDLVVAIQRLQRERDAG